MAHDYWSEQFEEFSKEETVNIDLPGDIYLEQAWSDQPVKNQPQIKIEEVEDLFRLEGLIDGGYMSFVYGSRRSEYGGWFNIKWQYKNFLMVMDSRESVRREDYSLYKSRRNERRKHYKEAMDTYNRVLEFRKVLTEDPSVRTISLEGYEADDIIALLYIKGVGDKVMAQDKDFFQVPNIQHDMYDHTGMCQDYRTMKLPKYALYPKGSASHVLTQALFGDKSDSIPRLLPSNGWVSRDLYADLVKSATKMEIVFTNCYSYWGEDFIRNLKLVLLPHHTMSIDGDEDLLMSVATGHYWLEENFDDRFLQTILTNINYLPEGWI